MSPADLISLVNTMSNEQRIALVDALTTSEPNPGSNNRPRNRTATTQRGATMATTSAKAKAKAKVAAAKAKRSTPAAKSTGTRSRSTRQAESASKPTAGKRAAAKADDATRTKTMLAMRKKGDSWATIAEALSITPGKAQFLMMLHRVATGDVPTISTNGTEAQVIKRIAAARKSADEFSSWGWIAARTGWSEPKIKNLLANSGDYSPRSENIAAVRAGNGAGKASTASKTNGGTRKRTATAGKGKVATAKAKAAARKSGARPSKRG